MVSALMREDTQERLRVAREVTFAQPEDGVGRLLATRYTLQHKLPLEALLPFRETWFAPGSQVDVETGLILRDTLLQKDERYIDLLRRVYELRSLSVEERREQMNPMRGNTLGTVIGASITVLLDHEDYLKDRMMGDRPDDGVLKTTTMEFGRKMEDWLGGVDYKKFAERALELRDVIKEKKHLGTRVPAITHEFRTTLDLSVEEVRRRVEEAQSTEEKKKKFETEFGNNLQDIKMKLEELIQARKKAPIKLRDARAVFAIGRLVMRYVGDNDTQMGKPLSLMERKELRSDILPIFNWL